MTAEGLQPHPDDNDIDLVWTAGNHPSKRETEGVMHGRLKPEEITAYDDPGHRLPGERGMGPDEKVIHDFGKNSASDSLPN